MFNYRVTSTFDFTQYILCDILFLRLKTLSSIDFRYSTVNDQCIKSLSTYHSSSLTYVNCRHSINLTDLAYCDLFSKCDKLRYIEIRASNTFTEKSIHALSSSKLVYTLEHFSLYLSKLIPEFAYVQLFTNCKHLKHIHMDRCSNLGVTTFNAIVSSCAELESLCLKNCDITVDKISVLSSGCVLLRSIFIEFNHEDTFDFDVFLIPFFDSHLYLTDITVNFISDLALSHLSNNTQLKSISFCRPKIDTTTTGFESICRSSSETLTTVKMSDATGDTIQYVSLYLSKILTCLFVEPHKRLDEIDDKSMMCIAQHCMNLKKISVCETVITDKFIVQLANNCSKLELFDAGKCMNLTDVSLFALTNHCKQLKILKIDGCELVTDTGVCFVIEQLPRISKLNIERCTLLTNKTAQAILDSSTLIDVKLNNINNISNHLKQQISSKCRK